MAQQQPSQREREKAYRQLQEEYRDRVRALVLLLLGGRMALWVWAQRVRAEIRALHLLVAAIGGGDLERDAELMAQVQRNVDRQMRYFQRWVFQLNGLDLTLDMLNGIVARANLYVAAVGETFFVALTRSYGLPILPFYPRDGATRCRVNCKCGWRIVKLKGNGNYDCYWQLAAAEHCPTCRARARVANPLQVRGGQIVNPERYQNANLYA